MNRAKDDIAAGRKHRGLVHSRQDDELAREHVSKAEHNLDFFLLAMKQGFYDWAINIGCQEPPVRDWWNEVVLEHAQNFPASITDVANHRL